MQRRFVTGQIFRQLLQPFAIDLDMGLDFTAGLFSLFEFFLLVLAVFPAVLDCLLDARHFGAQLVKPALHFVKFIGDGDMLFAAFFQIRLDSA